LTKLIETEQFFCCFSSSGHEVLSNFIKFFQVKISRKTSESTEHDVFVYFWKKPVKFRMFCAQNSFLETLFLEDRVSRDFSMKSCSFWIPNPHQNQARWVILKRIHCIHKPYLNFDLKFGTLANQIRLFLTSNQCFSMLSQNISQATWTFATKFLYQKTIFPVNFSVKYILLC
jgi:hypothetical protein